MSEKVGLMVVNLGSPASTDVKDVRKYLGQFLHDYRIIELTRWLWCPILHGIILRTRPRKTAEAYAKIWGDPDGPGPLVSITNQQTDALQQRLGEGVAVRTAMRYGQPSIASVIDELMEEGISKIAVLPMYPQYSATTTASIFDDVAKTLGNRRDNPEIRTLRNYYDEDGYLGALESSIRHKLKQMPVEPDLIMTSFHGLPKEYVDKGDPYRRECEATVALLKERLKDVGIPVKLTFQSRFGPKEWLQPYTDKTLEALPDEGVKSVLVLTPGFAADCIETLEEIDMENREIFEEAGGEHFEYLPCLNADKAHIDALEDIVRRRLLAGWI